jgi:hypothetical protein
MVGILPSLRDGAIIPDVAVVREAVGHIPAHIWIFTDGDKQLVYKLSSSPRSKSQHADGGRWSNNE